MNELDLIKHHLKQLPGGSLELIDKAWIEVVLERNNGNRTAACRSLGISICKIRSWIEFKGVRVSDGVIGHPKVVKKKKKIK
jgi:transcriptional regulator with AAA-type ATPase domain